MHRPHGVRRQVMTVAATLLAVIGAGAIAGGAVAGGAPRPEASLTDLTAEPPGAFVAVSPLRVLDTRPAPQGPIGVGASGPITQNSSIDLKLSGEGQAIPARATSAFLNITIDQDATLASFLTVWPTGEPRPLTSANNALPGLVASNTMLAKLGDGGSISIFNQQGDVNVVIDLLGYVVPLETPTVPTVPPTVPTTDPHAGLISGAGPPSSTDGSDGDFYLDTSSQVLSGPKTGGAWPPAGVALGGVQGAASAYNTGVVNLPVPTTAPVAVHFANAGPARGSVSRTNDTTFIVAEAGLYTVQFHLGFVSSASGTIAVFVNEVPTGNTTTLASDSFAADDVSIFATVGDLIQLRFAPLVAGASTNLDNSSILVEQTTAS